VLARDARHGGTVTRNGCGKLDWRRRFTPIALRAATCAVDQIGEPRAALLDRAVAEILAVKMEQIEGDELHLRRLPAGARGVEREEIRHPVLAQHHRLAVDDR
jgi:hypothetical protein